MNPDLAWEVWSRERSRRIESVLDRALAGADGPPPRLHDAMRYAALGGGKRVRALLAYAGGELAGADPDDVDGAAAAVELIHAYSLVHDDLPCMDDDVLRRGKPSCHVAFGEAIALLAGDALQSLAFEVLARTPAREPAAQIALLAQASGASGMAGGQAIDLNSSACMHSKRVRLSGRRFASAPAVAGR
jgi:farnesyl diphosphate synthase